MPIGTTKIATRNTNSGAIRISAVVCPLRRMPRRRRASAAPSAGSALGSLVMAIVMARGRSERWARDKADRPGRRGPSAGRGLLGEPLVEALGQLLVVIGPDLGVDHEGILRVRRRGRQVWQDLGRHLGDRCLERRTVGD